MISAPRFGERFRAHHQSSLFILIQVNWTKDKVTEILSSGKVPMIMMSLLMTDKQLLVTIKIIIKLSAPLVEEI